MDDDFILDDSNRNATLVRRRPAASLWPRMMQQHPVAVPYPTAPSYAQAPAYYQVQPQQPVVVRQKRILDMPAGEVLALAAQAFAALQPLPAPPSALGKADDDVSNLITYQSALATHAKRDEQLRTIGALVAKFLA